MFFCTRNKSTISHNKKREIKLITTVAAQYKDLENQKEIIFKENKGKIGVYKWINTKTGDFYIGSSVNLHKRLVNYFNLKYIEGYKNKSIIYSSLLKNGYKSFNLEVIEYCDKTDLIEKEQYYIDLLKPKYNILNLAGSSLGFKHKEETRKLISINNTKEKHPFFGKNHNEKSIRLMSINSSKAKPVTVINTKTNEKSMYNSNVSASKFLGVSEWTVRKCKNNNKLYKNIYKII